MAQETKKPEEQKKEEAKKLKKTRLLKSCLEKEVKKFTGCEFRKSWNPLINVRRLTNERTESI